MRAIYIPLALLVVFVVTSCGGTDAPPPTPPSAEPAAPSGAQWVATGGAPGETAWVNDVGTLSGEDAVAVGGFTNEVTFGAGEFNQTDLMGTAAFGDAFVARFDADNGTLVWAVAVISSTFVDVSNVVTIGGNGFLVVGYFWDDVTFGAGMPGAVTFTAAGPAFDEDCFVARFNGDGSLAWARQVGDTDIDEMLGVTVLPNGNTVVSGIFLSNTLTFGAGEANEETLTRSGEIDGFVAWYDTDNGDVLDVLHMEGQTPTTRVTCWAVSAFDDNNVAVSGDFTGTFRIQGSNPQDYTSTNISFDSWTARIDDEEDVAWFGQVRGTLSNRVFGMYVADGSDRVHVVGDFRGTAEFTNPGQIIPDQTLTSMGGLDGYLVTYEGDGDAEYATSLGFEYDDSLYDVYFDDRDRGIAIGFVSGVSDGSQGQLMGVENTNGDAAWWQATIGGGTAFGLALESIPNDCDLYVGGSFVDVAVFDGDLDEPVLATGAADAVVARLERD